MSFEAVPHLLSTCQGVCAVIQYVSLNPSLRSPCILRSAAGGAAIHFDFTHYTQYNGSSRSLTVAHDDGLVIFFRVTTGLTCRV